MKVVSDTSCIAQKIRELYSITTYLEEHFPGTKFTPDGHLVGSIGEVLAAEHYGLTLLDNSAETHDATTKSGQFVQIKATQSTKISISSQPQYLIVLRILPSGDWEEIYNGPGQQPWEQAGKLQKNGQRSLSLSKLKELMKTVSEANRIKK